MLRAPLHIVAYLPVLVQVQPVLPGCGDTTPGLQGFRGIILRIEHIELCLLKAHVQVEGRAVRRLACKVMLMLSVRAFRCVVDVCAALSPLGEHGDIIHCRHGSIIPIVSHIQNESRMGEADAAGQEVLYRVSVRIRGHLDKCHALVVHNDPAAHRPVGLHIATVRQVGTGAVHPVMIGLRIPVVKAKE